MMMMIHPETRLLYCIGRRLDRGIHSTTEMLPLKRGGMLHIVLTATHAFVVYASCWRTCFILCNFKNF